jgi:hypothetical protein
VEAIFKELSGEETAKILTPFSLISISLFDRDYIFVIAHAVELLLLYESFAPELSFFWVLCLSSGKTFDVTSQDLFICPIS